MASTSKTPETLADPMPDRNTVFTAVAQSITVLGFLCVGGLLAAGLVFGDLAAVICALFAAGASYVAMYATMVALTNSDSHTAYQIAILVNPTMTLLAACFWAVGVFQLWG